MPIILGKNPPVRLLCIVEYERFFETKIPKEWYNTPSLSIVNGLKMLSVGKW